MSAVAWFALGVCAGVMLMGAVVIAVGLVHLRDDDAVE